MIFDFAEKAEKLEALQQKAFRILKGNERYASVIDKIQADLAEKGKENKLRITFVGQYSSGKSTIISALTGNAHIKIDSDIATDRTTSYEWNSVLLIDTPGLYTHHKEHDAITEAAIKQADIVVYCLTYSLFDNLLLNDFNKLAYERGYAGKMFLVVNKMDGEYGEYDELRSNYSVSLKKSLGESQFKQFPISFVVAQWQRESDPEVRAESHFDDFVQYLNDFIDRNGKMQKLLSPANIFIDNIQQGIIENNDAENKEFFQIIDRIERQFKRQERDGDSFFHSLVTGLHDSIVNYGYEFSNLRPKDQAEAEKAVQDIGHKLAKLCEEKNSELAQKLDDIQEELNVALREISQSELVNNFYAQHTIGKINVGVAGEARNNKEMLDNLFGKANKISGVVGAKAAELAGAASKTAVEGLLRSGQAAGSQLHTTVYSVGKFFGHNFRPWEAVNITKNIGNVAKGVSTFAKILGPLLSVVSIGFEIADTIKEQQQAEAERKYRRDILSQFTAQADEVVKEFTSQFNSYKESEIHGKIKDIRAERSQRTANMRQTDDTAKSLKVCVDEFKAMVRV
jgi:small GTP-binding protein